MFIFDLDGVVTNPETGTVNADILSHIAKDLTQQYVVALNTGRPYEWAQEHILEKLENQVSPADLENLLLVAEMGGVIGRYRHGKLHVELDQTLSLSGSFVEDVVRMLDEQRTTGERFSDYMWWDGLKKTMGSLVKWDHVSVETFNRIRPLLATNLEALLRTHGLDDFVLGQTTIATDIQHKTAGKHKGAQQIKAWLDEQNISPQTFYTFGDSVSDKAMAEEFATSTNAQTVFVFVGDPRHEDEVKGQHYTTTITGGGYDKDTATYLASV